jgi:hypothetical protein
MGTKTELKAVLHETLGGCAVLFLYVVGSTAQAQQCPPSGALHLLADTAGGRQR